MSLSVVIPTIGLDNRGGTRIYLQLANILSQRGHLIKILLPIGSNTTTFFIDPRVEIRPVGLPVPQIEDLSSILRLMMLFPLLNDCDVVLANYYLTSYPVAFSSLFKRSRKNVNLIQHYEPMAFGEAERTFPKLKKWLGETSYRFPMVQIAVAHWIAKRVSLLGKQDVRVIYPNIDLSVFAPPDKFLVRDGNSILIFPGKDIWKGWADFVCAFEMIESGRPEINVIASSRLPFPLPAGSYLGRQPGSDEELVRLYQTASVYVHPAWWEGCPLSPLEAMACGTPVVAAASEGILEYAVNGENCLLVPPKSPKLLADAILRVLDDGTLRKRLVQGGFETVRHFAWPRMADEFEALLLSICA